MTTDRASALRLQPHPEGAQCSAWHRVASDEAWHLLEGGPLRLWLLPPDLSRRTHVDLAPVDDAALCAALQQQQPGGLARLL